ncbi:MULTISPECIES: response regulator [Vibrio]|jgi:two-component system response regulator RstA|uniref:DNA-binding response regulator n=1 Tax=Vibrio rotiferianus TaxID=190895 RepID=A0ABX3DDV2_9VIBR|nr:MULTISPECIES: response regulator [Vibrio]ASI93821.1 DNA-binding response regulator [Vibrio rotiferianus]MDK9777424.1 response regulator [Vibrio sp. D401a]MDK9806664.1 response regulator [Vibrio sp. D406a]OHY96241.1 DNA-binding response regulator [Vibrio rotiferianus]TMX31033.1 DNA-binding response regulator [Vibrio rotiferianus]
MNTQDSKPSLIIVEDDPKLQAMLSEYFSQQGFEVSCIDNGTDAPEAIIENQPDLVLLDLMLPGQDGLSVCRQVRDCYKGKILMLTASDDDFDHVAALEIGADDFVTKPIKPRVLLARIRMLLRRKEVSAIESDICVEVGVLCLNRLRKACALNKEPIALTDGEFDLLWVLATRPEQTLSREWLTKTLRGIEYDGTDRTIDNRIVTLRKKLGDSTTPPQKIITVRGKGYLFMPDAWNV